MNCILANGYCLGMCFPFLPLIWRLPPVDAREVVGGSSVTLLKFPWSVPKIGNCDATYTVGKAALPVCPRTAAVISEWLVPAF